MFGELFTTGVSDIIDSIDKGLDNLFTSDEERLQARNVLEQAKLDAVYKSKQLNMQYEAEITKRNNADQTSGNFLTKSARPIFLYWIMFIITVIIFGGMVGYVVIPEYIGLVQALAITAVSFFFGSKGFEIYKHGKVI